MLNTTERQIDDKSRPRRYVVVGPDQHGVVTHGLRLSAAEPRLGDALLRLPSLTSGVRRRGLVLSIAPGSAVMLQVTDRLLGSTPEEAARVVGELGRRMRLALALHDIPQPAEGADWFRRRRDAYAAMTTTAEVVVVASEHERTSLERCLANAADDRVAGRIVVVPLPIEPTAAERRPADVHETEVGILGYLYPGKGVEEVLASAAALRGAGRPVRVTCIGAPAEGHAEHATTLVARARRTAVPFEITGFVPEHELRSRLRGVGVPVAPHRHISASGSINAWLEVGRRPVTLPSPYARELDQRLPGAVNVADDLESGILAVLEGPERSWLDPGVVLGPSVREVARRHADVLDELAEAKSRTAVTARVFA